MPNHYHVMVTLTDIAKEVGVAPQVVSRVLNGGKGTASARLEVRERIKKVAAQRGYRPFAAGQMLRARAFHSVGVLIGRSQDFLISQETLAGLARGLASANYSATLHYMEDVTDAALLDSRLIASRRTDALLIPYVRTPSRTLCAALNALPIPVCWLNRRARTNSVIMNESGAARLLVDHLAYTGHRRICFLDYSSGGRDAHTRDRLRGFRQATQRSGLEGLTELRSIARPDRAAAARDFLQRLPKPCALIVNSLSAAQVLLQVASQQELQIPVDLALASFDQDQAYSANVPAITCALRPDFTFGTAVAEMVLQRIKAPDQPVKTQSVDFTLAVGGTTHAS